MKINWLIAFAIVSSVFFNSFSQKVGQGSITNLVQSENFNKVSERMLQKSLKNVELLKTGTVSSA